jgi:hypothetical protein
MGLRYLCTKVTRSAAIAASSNKCINADVYRAASFATLSTLCNKRRLCRRSTLKMKKCWANTLGDCSDKISREHIVSKSLFTGDKVSVHGFPWCKEEPVEVGISAITSKILCEDHNGRLSELDAAASHAFKVLREVERLSQVRRKLKKRYWRVAKYKIDGTLLERWFLKTTINICYRKDFLLDPNNNELGIPSQDIVQIAFGMAKFSNGRGLYNASYVGQDIYTSEAVSMQPIYRDSDNLLIGAFFFFFGFSFYLSILPDPFTGDEKREFGLNENLDKYNLNYHLTTTNEKILDRLSQQVHFTWE